MMNAYSDLTLAAWMSWFQFAVLFVPIVLAMMYFEYRDWRQEHPRMASRIVRQQPRKWKPILPFVVPM